MRFFVLLLLAISPVPAALRDIKVIERAGIDGGKAFGKTGPYERIIAKAYFTVDPKLPANRIITDLRYARVNDEGLVEFSADLYVLRPLRPAGGNGSILFEVSNRGGRGLLGLFNAGSRRPDDSGDGFLFEQGYTLVWVGWQFDVPDRAGAIRLIAPEAQGVSGWVRSQNAIGDAAATISVADRDHKPYLASDPGSPENKMYVRDYSDGPRRQIPRDRWRFVDPATVSLDGGFQAGKTYEVIYTSKNPAIAALGPAAIRDLISFLKYGDGASTFLNEERRSLKRAIAFGSSQSGRFLRTYLYYGFNADEQGRKVFDGVMPHIAGAARGSFVHRFAQPSLGGTQLHSDLFPFRDLPDTDPVTGMRDSLLRITSGSNTTPKIFYTNTANEYWRSSSSLIHTSLEGGSDAPVAPETRIYFLTGCQHGSGGWPPTKSEKLLYTNNALDYRPLLRALLVAMNEWVTSGKEPPASRYPTVGAGQLVAPQEITFPKIPGFQKPAHVWQARRLDYGSDYAYLGITTNEPPKLIGKPFQVLLPQVDTDGNETGGIRNPVHAVPLGTHMGWNLAASPGPDSEMANLIGSYIPFPKTRADRERTGDTRLSIAERYGSREEYLQRITAAANQLVRDRYLLAVDVARIQERARSEWDTLTRPSNAHSAP